MVLGMKANNNRRSAMLQAEYIIHLKEIKPWPPSQSLNSLRPVLIQWENETQSSGSTTLVVPTLGSVVGEGKIEFNQSFNISVALPRMMSIRSNSFKAFQKNCLELNLYEPRRDKVKGLLLGTAIINFAEYGILKEVVSINLVLNCKRNFRNISQPVLYVDVEPVNNGLKNSWSSNSLVREMSLDRNGGESVLALMSEEYAKEAGVKSVTDDDGSSHSSLTVSSSAYEYNDDLIYPSPTEELQGSLEYARDKTTEVKSSNMAQVKSFSTGSSVSEIASAAVSPVKVEKCFSSVLRTNLRPVSASEVVVASALRSPHQLDNKDTSETVSNAEQETMGLSFETDSSLEKNSDIGEFDEEEAMSHVTTLEETGDNIVEYLAAMKAENRDLSGKGEISIQEKDSDSLNAKLSNEVTESFTKELDVADTDAHSTNKEQRISDISATSRLKHVKSVRSLSSFTKNDASDRSYGFHEDASKAIGSGERKELKFHSRGSSTCTENRVLVLEQRIKILEAELSEAAAIEVALYSVVAEHGSSISKVHTPARRLSRLYLHASGEKSQASAAKSSVSGLVLVTKTCGNDVPRLMYWLSNCVVLRSIITLATQYDELPLSTGLDVEEDEDTDKSSTLNDDDFVNLSDWSDPQMYIRALEKVEGWIFSRIIESLWWQTLVPYMQCYEESFNHIHITSLINSSRNDDSYDKNNFPVELWNEAFKEASERLCPVRATMRECGCLPVLSQLVIEQCVARLDVSMFNAIFRESADEVPTDPVSDPIGDSRVLPVPVGKSSFGAGAQLKNALGNWSRRLSELFHLDGHELPEDETEQNTEDERQDTCTKFFYLLNTLSDLMMLPKDLLLDKSVRKEVCPSLGAPLIKRLLNFHVPDEFCSDLVPVALLEALDCEDSNELGEECITHVPCRASPPVYHPPLADSLAYIIGNSKTPELKNSGSLLIRKSYTSDDELDELRSPLSYILMDGTGLNSTHKPVKEEASALRYQLLKELWRNSP